MLFSTIAYILTTFTLELEVPTKTSTTVRSGLFGFRNIYFQILLVYCNVEEPRHQLRELNLLCFRMEWTLVVCHTVEEAGEYIENLKLVETRDPGAQKYFFSLNYLVIQEIISSTG